MGAGKAQRMIFNSQSAITDPTREPAWAEWYEEHLRIMATVPGVFSAQRFLTTHVGHPRSYVAIDVVTRKKRMGDAARMVIDMEDLIG